MGSAGGSVISWAADRMRGDMSEQESKRYGEQMVPAFTSARTTSGQVKEPPASEVVTPRGSPPEQRPRPEAAGDAAGVSVSTRGHAYLWRARVPHIVSPRGAMIVMLAAALIIISTFINWVQGSTGWNIVFRSFGTSGTFFLTWWSKGLLFSGFWSLLIGILIVVGGIMFLTDREGGTLLVACGIAGVVIALFDIVMIYANGAYFPAGPGLGLWLLVGISLVTVALGLSVVPAGEASAD